MRPQATVMAHSVACLLSRREDLDSDPQQPRKSQVQVQACHPSAGVRWFRNKQISGACWPAHGADKSVPSSGRDCASRTKVRESLEKVAYVSLCSPDTWAQVYIHIHNVHTYMHDTHTHICTGKNIKQYPKNRRGEVKKNQRKKCWYLAHPFNPHQKTLVCNFPTPIMLEIYVLFKSTYWTQIWQKELTIWKNHEILFALKFTMFLF